MTAETVPNPEIYNDPFEGLAIDSPAEQLALAEVWQEILELDDHGSEKEQILELQMQSIEKYLGQPGMYPGYSDGTGITLREIQDKAQALGYSGPIHNGRGGGTRLVWEKAANARWRMTDIDKDSLTDRQVEQVEKMWRDTSEARRSRDLGDISLEIAKLDETLDLIEMGVINGEDGQKNDLMEQRRQLSQDKSILTSDLGHGNSGAGWGQGNSYGTG